jgi:hypothetical protein
MPFNTRDKEAKEEDDPRCPVIYVVGRLEANSLCVACRSTDFAALFSRSEAYLTQHTGYQCTPRTVAHISQYGASCLFCLMTYCCLASLHLDNIPNSGTFTVTSHAQTAGIRVNTNDEELDVD